MAESYITKSYLQTQFQNYSEVIKDNFAKKEDVVVEKIEYTTTEDASVTNVKEALDTIFAGGIGEGGSGDNNIIESISVNGTALSPDENKNVNITIPDTSEFITKAVSDLENYYLKTDTYSVEEIDGMLEAITTLDINVVDSLPVENISKTTIYLMKKEEVDEQNVYSEYINLDGTENGWECIGDTKVDLTECAKISEVEDLINDELYISTTIASHYEMADADTEGALEVVVDGTTLEDGQIEQSSVTGIDVEVGDYVVLIPEATVSENKYAEKANTYCKTEIDTKLEDYVNDSDIEILTVEQIEELIGLSDEEIESILSDTTIELNKTWSSSYINNKLNETLDSAKAYTLSELSKAVSKSYAVITSIDDVISDKILYLYKEDGAYNIYIYNVDTTSAELVGSFSVNLDDYYTKHEVDDTFVNKTDFDTLTDSIGDVSTLDTDDKTVVGAINEVGTIVDEILDGTTTVPKAENASTLDGLTLKEITVNGVRNIIEYPYFDTTRTSGGLSWVDNNDGTISVSGENTTEGQNIFNLRTRKEEGNSKLVLKPGKYTVSGCPEGSSGASDWYIQVGKSDANGEWSRLGNDYGQGVTISLEEETQIQIQLIVRTSNHVDFTFKPMMVIGDVAYDYVPYNIGGSKNADMLDGYHASDFLEKEVLCETTLGYFCKNLIPYPYTANLITNRGITFAANSDGSIGFSGVADNELASYFTIPKKLYLPAGTYKISGGDDIYGGVGVLLYDDADTTILYTGNYSGLLKMSSAVYVFTTKDGTVDWTVDNTYGYEKEFTIDKPAYVKVQARSTNTTYTEEVGGIIYPMLRRAEFVDGTWEEYKPNVKTAMENNSSDIAIAKTTLGCECKNVFPYPYGNTTLTNKGVTFTDNGDGTITVDGTAEEDTAFVFGNQVTLPVGQYILSGAPVIEGKFALQIADTKNNLWIGDVGETAKFTVIKDTTFDYNRILIGAGVTVTNQTFKPMIRRAEITDATWKAYTPNINTKLNEALCGNKKVKIINNQAVSSAKWYKITNIPTATNKSVTCKLYAQRINFTQHIETISFASTSSSFTYTQNIELQEKMATGAMPEAANASHFVLDANNDLWVRVASYTYAVVELTSPNLEGTFVIDGKEGTPVEDYKLNMFNERGVCHKIKTIEVPIEYITNNASTVAETGVTTLSSIGSFYQATLCIKEEFFTKNNITPNKILNMFIGANGDQGGYISTDSTYGISDIWQRTRNMATSTVIGKYCQFNILILRKNGNSSDSTTQWKLAYCTIRYEVD